MKNKSKCPACGKEIDTLPYVEHGSMVWDGNEWTSDPDRGDIEYYCPECDYKLEYEELERLGVF